ncbi:MAG: hypothetical protein U5L10_03535 [Candidatus Moranbacteria bacterium]|nr:hypothetical protein [Candidatus Moranbacteria bacterium]
MEKTKKNILPEAENKKNDKEAKKDSLRLGASLFLFVFVLSACFFFEQGTLVSAQGEEQSTGDIEESSESSDEDQEELKEKKKEKEELKEEAEDVEEKLEETEEEAREAESELQKVNRRIINTKYEIQKTQEVIDGYKDEISNKNKKIEDLERDIEFKKQILGEYLRHFRKGMAEIGLVSLDSSKSLGGYFRLVESYEGLQKKISETLERIRRDKRQIEQGKEQIEEKKESKEEVQKAHESQRQRLQQQENQKAVILNQKSREISEKKATLSELRAKIAKVEGELSALLGESYDTDDIMEAAEFASDATGVRKDFLLGMLVVESDLGRYTGGCTYDEVKDGSKEAYENGRLSQRSYDLMKERKDIFEDIIDELGYNEDDVKVSCNPSSYIGTGGAMGVAQFMADTWTGYKDSVTAATGHDPPDPWSLIDGVTAMALKLDKVPGVDDHDKDKECYAAKLYLGSTSADWYCERIFYWADNYEEKL